MDEDHNFSLGKANKGECYDILQIPKGSPLSEIKRAYKKMALAHHPDKGGDEEAFKQVQNAYSTLTEGKTQGHENKGKQAPRGSAQPKNKAEDLIYELNVSVNDLSNGAVKRFLIVRNRICKTCEGQGSTKPGVFDICPLCKGSGNSRHFRTKLRQFQNESQVCMNCGGAGGFIPERHRCRSCNGDTVTRKRKVLEVSVLKAMEYGHTIVLEGEGHEAPGLATGDLIVVLMKD